MFWFRAVRRIALNPNELTRCINALKSDLASSHQYIFDYQGLAPKKKPSKRVYFYQKCFAYHFKAYICPIINYYYNYNAYRYS